MGFRRLQFTHQTYPRPAVGRSSDRATAADPPDAGDGWPCLCNHCRRIRGDSARHEQARQRYIEQMQTDAEGA